MQVYNLRSVCPVKSVTYTKNTTTVPLQCNNH